MLLSYNVIMKSAMRFRIQVEKGGETMSLILAFIEQIYTMISSGAGVFEIIQKFFDFFGI